MLPDQWHTTQRKPQLDVDDEDEGEGGSRRMGIRGRLLERRNGAGGR